LPKQIPVHRKRRDQQHENDDAARLDDPTGIGRAEINAAGASMPEPPIPGDCQRCEQQQGNNFFRV
jgi:hypothetical protein